MSRLISEASRKQWCRAKWSKTWLSKLVLEYESIPWLDKATGAVSWGYGRNKQYLDSGSNAISLGSIALYIKIDQDLVDSRNYRNQSRSSCKIAKTMDCRASMGAIDRITKEIAVPNSSKTFGTNSERTRYEHTRKETREKWLWTAIPFHKSCLARIERGRWDLWLNHRALARVTARMMIKEGWINNNVFWENWKSGEPRKIDWTDIGGCNFIAGDLLPLELENQIRNS